MMNGEVQPSVNVPIVTLAGLSNLTNLLTELPLPKPKEPTGKKKSLLFSPRVADDARRVLASANPNIISQMAHVLKQTNVDHIQLKEGYQSDVIPDEVPELVRVLLAQHPDALAARRPGFERHPLFASQQQHTQAQNQQSHRTLVPQSENSYPVSSSHADQSNHFTSQPNQQYTQQSQQQQDVYEQSSHSTSGGGYTNQHQAQTPASSQQVDRRVDMPPTPPLPHSYSDGTPSHMERPTPSAVQVDPLTQTMHTSPPAASAAATPKPHKKQKHHRQHSQVEQTPTPHMTSTQMSTPGRPDAREATPSVSTIKHENDSKPAGARVSLQPLSATEIDKYTTPVKMLSGTSRGSAQKLKPSEKSSADKSAQPLIKLTKLELGSQYQVATASEGLKIKIKKADGSMSKKDKRRRSSGEGDEYEEHPKKKKKKHKHHKEHKSLRREHTLDRMDSDLYNNVQLIAVIDGILDSCNLEDMPSTVTLLEDETEFSISSDILISRGMLSDLIHETAKLKGSSVTREVPIERLTRLMNILHWNVRDGAKLIPMLDQSDGADSEMLRELVLERVHRTLDASLAALSVMTSSDMPKMVYLEDLIELIAETVKFQLTNTVYPEYDPVYDTKKEKDYSSNKQKRARSGGPKQKSITLMYNKLCDVMQNLTELVTLEPLTDTIILKISSLSVQPFFVENISELQLSAITLVTEVFSRYEKHRQLILDDMFLSLARLPTTKRNIRAYRLSHEENIQMVTALVLQLIQCIIKLPTGSESEPDEDTAAQDVIIATSYEQAMKTAHHFLSVFLKKCGQKGEEDYRPLFDNFVNDLLMTANKPEWPGAELMLSLLGRLLVNQFSNKSVDMSLRVASLDYLGTVAARLRKDAVCTQQTEIDELLEELENDSSSSDEESKSNRRIDQTDVVYKLQATVLDYLLVNGQKDPSLLNARSFYIAQWYRDIVVQVEKLTAKQAQIDPNDVDELERLTELQAQAERKKNKLLEQAKISMSTFRSGSKLSYGSTSNVTKFLTSQRPFAQSFDLYLTQILKVLSETVVAVRTKAIKCLTLVIEADPGVLSRTSLQTAVHARLLDQSTSVREACVELIGKFILSRPELMTQYYDMLSARILDTGISVRKRVIKIFRDVCIDMPNFEKIPDMCVKMIRRVNDEDGIKKLVSEVFQSMWFTPVRDRDNEKLMRRVLNITSVISAIQDANYDFMEQLMKHLLYKERESSSKPMDFSCRQIVDCLVMNVLKLEQKAVEISSGTVATSRDLLASLSTLHLFSKIRPDLMISHAETLQPYLEIKCSNAADVLVLHHTSRILELVIPLMPNPRESFLAQVEEDLMTLILSQGMTVLQSAVSCLGAVVNKVTKNYALVRDCFKKFQNIVHNCHKQHQVDPKNQALLSRKGALKRSLFTVGVLCKHFDFDTTEMGMKSQAVNSIEDFVFEQLMYFLWHEDEGVRQQALTAIGFFCIRYYDKMMSNRVKDLYHRLLIGKDVSSEMRVQVLNNLGKYLQEEEESSVRAEEEWKKRAAEENLKEIGDVQSGMASTIVQVFLKQVLESYFNSQLPVRIAAVSVLHLILKQGLVHPVQCVPYLITMSTDCDNQVTIKADQHLIDIDKKHAGFIHMKAMQGIKMSYRLHRIVQQDMYQPLRGIHNDESPASLNQHLYSIIRTNRGHRRALLNSMLNLFDDTSKTLLGELVYMADNLVFFPYTAADEPLYIIHNIDIIVSVAGSNLLQAFREGMLTKDGTPFEPPQEVENSYMDPVTGEVKVVKTLVGGTKLDDDDDDDFHSLIARLPDDCTPLQEIMIRSQGCVLLLLIKQHLKEMYNITDSKLQKYSPNEAQKVWERPISRKVNHKFNPEKALELLREGSPRLDNIDDDGKRKLLEDFLAFKQLMMSVDPNDDDEEEEDKNKTAAAGGGTPPLTAEEYNDPEHPGYADPNADITSYAPEEANALAATMQPTISLMPMGELPPEYLAQIHGGPSTSGMMSHPGASNMMPSYPAHQYPSQQYPPQHYPQQHYPSQHYPPQHYHPGAGQLPPNTQSNTWDSEEESTDDE